MDKCFLDKFIFGNNCVISCLVSKCFLFNGICMVCYEVGKFDDGLKCVDKC